LSPHVLIALENEPYPFDRRVLQEAEALLAAGYEVTVCGPTGFGYDAPEEWRDGVHVLRYPMPEGGRSVAGYLREYAVSLLRLGRLMRRAHARRPVDVAIVCCPPDLLVLPALVLRRSGAAVIMDHHDLSPELFAVKFGERRALQRLVRAAESFALRRSDVVMATNGTYAELEQRRGPVDADRVFVVRNGPDPARIHPVPPRDELRHGHERMVLWIGVMSEQEGLHHLIAAAEELIVRRGRRELGVAIVGSGDAREQLMEDARRRGLADHVHFPGRADDDHVRAYMATADVCVSVDEPNPMNDSSTMIKVIEYMLMGRPIVQFRLHETSRLVGDASLYARPGDAHDLSDKIADLLDDSERAAELGTIGRERAMNGLLWEQQVPQLIAAVEAAIRFRGAGR
jgi:glycosyltransferase involved in cell wall biosynthesis